ncbi:aspartyl/asparaginyl beta-hydroxylase domain-containing protein [Belliella sp. DSM 111904]|uniref:Aspartyl/asparaginyl beta-hydroxylase domain-containing protein n=1 Tax=Belliella filtrata TaxID=2923435 RepID=A0ABS9V2P2_9BACT|nr:aspartyl/asparaginyl beta-hydroxylase domain-containing protein [Belliella filtrata]MCH7410673.1 aspartyl/asparaginyl beta-hydroxylase domain-containing protein [Belliella filtrata]
MKIDNQAIAPKQVEIVKNQELEPWYSIFGGRYQGDHPPFYEPEHLSWTKILEDNWKIIRDELFGLIEADPDRLKPYKINKSMSFPPKKWKTMGLIFWNMKNHKNCSRCPQTMKILKSLPGCTSASLSILEPHSNINPHQGDTDAVIRCHMGLSIPSSIPDCGFQVENEIREWREGKTLPFCDARTHTAWNHTSQRRYIMILDVIRPEFKNRKNEICAHVLASAAVQMLYQKYDFLRRRKRYVKKAIYHAVRVAMFIYLPFQRISFIR